MINRNKKLNKGYTLLFAVLVSSIVLAIGISILTISKKEFLLAASARESTYAFYAADSGRECAVYHNDNGNLATTSLTFPADSLYSSPFNCGVGSITPTYSSSDKFSTFTFTFHMNINGNSCAIVTVQQYYDNSDTTLGNIPRTTIISRGYNTGWRSTSCAKASTRRVERALQLTY